MMSYPTLNKWKLTYHSYANKSWRECDYIEKCTISSLKDFWEVHNNLVKLGNLIDNDYFLMKNDINPMWEDKRNRNGIIVSIKIPEKIIESTWTLLVAMIIGETFSTDNHIINGVSIKYVRDKPSKIKAPQNHALIKIWTQRYTGNIRSSVTNFTKNIIPKYIHKQYTGYAFSIQETIMKPQY